MSVTESGPETPPTRAVVNESDTSTWGTPEWMKVWKQQEAYLTSLERRLNLQDNQLEESRQESEKLKTHLSEAQQRERAMLRRLTAKEHETQDYMCQLTELKQSQTASAASLRSTLLDPAVNLILQQIKSELQATRSKLEDTQNELTAWKFTPDSNIGKRLMAKCRLLYQENEELGRAVGAGRVAKLESELALARGFCEEVRAGQNELDAFLADLDEDVEGMQSTILLLQQELRKEKSNAAWPGQQGGEAKRPRRASVLSIDYDDDLCTNGDGASSDHD